MAKFDLDREKLAEAVGVTRKMRQCGITNESDPYQVESVLDDARQLAENLTDPERLEQLLVAFGNKYERYPALNYASNNDLRLAAEGLTLWKQVVEEDPKEAVKIIFKRGSPTKSRWPEFFSSDTIIVSPLSRGFLTVSLMKRLLEQRDYAVADIEPVLVNRPCQTAILSAKCPKNKEALYLDESMHSGDTCIPAVYEMERKLGNRVKI